MTSRPRMHEGQVRTSVELARRLVASQFPEWAKHPLSPVTSFGTDHDIYRLGEDLAVRLPIVEWAKAQADKEAVWLPVLRDELPLRVPRQVARGEPGYGFPFAWSVSEWLAGESAAEARLDLDRAAEDLAAFVRALRSVSTRGTPARPRGARGSPLAELDAGMRKGISELTARLAGERARGGQVSEGVAMDGVAVDQRDPVPPVSGPPSLDLAELEAVWGQALGADPHPGPGSWVHGDLLPGNLIVQDGRLTGVIDFGGLNVGDPACDLQPAWSLFDEPSRAVFREALDVDDAAWRRGRGWSAFQAVMALPYYRDTNPGIVRQSWRVLSALGVADIGRVE